MADLKLIRVKRNEHTAEEIRGLSRNLMKGEVLNIDYTVSRKEKPKSN